MAMPIHRVSLNSPGLGPTVMDRLEQSGIASIETLRTRGVHTAVEAMASPGTTRPGSVVGLRCSERSRLPASTARSEAALTAPAPVPALR